MFSIDTNSDKKYYIILKDGVEFVKINKKNDIELVKKQFQIEVIK